MRRLLSVLFCVLAASMSALAFAGGGATVEAASAAPTSAAVANLPAATLKVLNRKIFEFHATFLGVPPIERAARARTNIEALLLEGGASTVSVTSVDQGRLVEIDGRMVFLVAPGDVDPLGRQTIDEVAAQAAKRLQQVVSETSEGRTLEAFVRALIASAIATVVFAAVLWVLARGHRWTQRVIVHAAAQKAESLTVAGAVLLDKQRVFTLLRRLLAIVRWFLVAIVSYEWLSFILSRFPYTRPWGEQLNEYLLTTVFGIVFGIVDTIPGIGVAIAIFFVARFGIGLLHGFFERVSSGENSTRWLDADTMPTTRRLASIAVWLFAIAMAYPYLPGAQTEAFKGLSVLIGLMVSLGASSIVGQGAAGLILTYSRTIKVGEYVRIGDQEGTVTEMGMFTTRIRTGLGEELTLPNSLITGSVTKNYSRVVKGRGYVLDTVVTIGYDTPWRQVEAMLLEAAKRTSGILQTPSPRVFQTALSDYYPEYRLVCQAVPEQPRPRAEVLSLLHANIQDVFNEHGVQIMSPHYMGDPAEAKVVAPEQWYLSPAKKPEA
ncbi:MAG: mechanosensitive ion channel family protein [Betaproteobacteria bacterium]|uniref:Small-conductance mechanosensitive channel n=1 Tax=Candidatus Proximibacter danicus TaxID=2954365 RepID=A0A9D7K0P3_9PROT|nr:mechanosensitive ion channel family protein [Candidatus Proximibacter danicus]